MEEEDDNTYLKTGDGYKLIHEKHYLEEARKALSAFAGAEEHTPSLLQTLLRPFKIS